MRSFTLRLLSFIACCGLAGSLLGQLGSLNWFTDMLNQLQLYAVAGGLIITLGAMALKARTLKIMGVILICSGLLAVAPALSLTPSTAHITDHKLKLFYFNVLSINQRQADVKNAIEQEAPDVVVLLEGNYRWEDTVATLRSAYPHQHLLDNPAHFGIIVLSKFPLTVRRSEHLRSDEGILRLALTVADIDHPSGTIRVIAAHPVPPLDARLHRARDQAIGEISSEVASSPFPLILTGDFNATPWTHSYRTLVREHDLYGTSFQASWPSFLGLFGIPIDQVLVGHGAQLMNLKTGPQLGSDHLPRIATINLP